MEQAICSQVHSPARFLTDFLQKKQPVLLLNILHILLKLPLKIKPITGMASTLKLRYHTC